MEVTFGVERGTARSGKVVAVALLKIGGPAVTTYASTGTFEGTESRYLDGIQKRERT